MRTLRPGLWLFTAFSAAVFASVHLLPAGMWPWLGLGMLAPAGLCVWRHLRPAGLVCLGVAAALLWCAGFRAVFFAPADALDGRRTQVRAVLSEQAVATPYGARASCWVTGEGRIPVKATLYAGDALLELSPGDRVTALCQCERTARPEESVYSDRAARGVFVTLKAQGALTVDRAETTPWWCLPRLWGQRLAGSIQSAFPEDVSGLFAALVTGERAGLSADVQSDLSRTGVYHLVAVSGLHVCFLVSLLTLFTGFAPRRRVLVCVPVLVFFALAVGAVPSVLRACLFQLSFLLADLLGREEDRWVTLTGTLALLLLLDPFSATDVGLQMSFAAVTGIALITPRIQLALGALRIPGDTPLARAGNLLWPRLVQIFAASVGAMTFTVPLSVWYFGYVSLLAPLTNLLVLPVASVLFAGGMLTGLAGLLVPAAARWAGWLLAWLGRYVLWVVRTLARIPYCALTKSSPLYPACLAGLYLLALMALLWKGQRRRARLFLLCGGALLLTSILLTRWDFSRGRLTAAVLDVGQGQSVILSSKGQTAVLDCGGSGRKNAGDVCADYLGDRGVGTVDALILTHYHTDHTNGLDELFHRLRIDRVFLPRIDADEETQRHILALARAEGAEVFWLDADADLALGEASLHLFPPQGGRANEACLSLLARAGGTGLLFTGDMDAAMETKLASRGDLGRCQVLLAGHHGARTSSCETLLSAVRPETALVSVGENTYGHPDPETLERFARHAISVRRTDQEGTLTVKVP